ncbi:uncharacterized protein LOC115370008 isoform X2 [Myripristis murdjan]|uniref:uncharacterized protein LOC115370008 isoform X2 n=1 Tax=Myripristis murdjan TaxID=586833 RepID=UPI00117616E3|nr:uncharacterized protein LOC115370008 isoform X2 [Myripristis murdjan]
MFHRRRKIAGKTMPQTVMDPTSRKGSEVHHDTSKVAFLVNGLTKGTSLVNGDFVHKGGPDAVPGMSDSAAADTVNGTKPQSMVNGAMPAWCKCKTAVPSKMLWKQGSMISGVSDASTANVVNSTAVPADGKMNGATSPDTAGLPNVAPEESGSSQPAPAKNQKKRGKDVTPPLQPQEEDWESPEDVLSFALRHSSLKTTDTTIPSETASYMPAWHHPRPVQWACCYVPTEPDQFADAD